MYYSNATFYYSCIYFCKQFTLHSCAQNIAQEKTVAFFFNNLKLSADKRSKNISSQAQQHLLQTLPLQHLPQKMPRFCLPLCSICVKDKKHEYSVHLQPYSSLLFVLCSSLLGTFKLAQSFIQISLLTFHEFTDISSGSAAGLSVFISSTSICSY